MSYRRDCEQLDQFIGCQGRSGAAHSEIKEFGVFEQGWSSAYTDDILARLVSMGWVSRIPGAHSWISHT